MLRFVKCTGSARFDALKNVVNQLRPLVLINAAIDRHQQIKIGATEPVNWGGVSVTKRGLFSR
jgi:hypothetical protein